MENTENKTPQTILRVLVIIGILAILVFLSIGIVRIVPRAINALASATVSITSLFNPKTDTATSTVATSTGGFVIIGNNSSTTNSTSSQSTSGTQTNTQNSNSYNYNYSNSGTYTGPQNTAYVPGNPDLAVTILSKGIISKSTGQYFETNTFSTNDTVVVKFKVENRGVGSTGVWNLQVNMPSNNTVDQVRNITNIGSIPPGLAIEGQAVFDQPRTTNNPTVSIVADPANGVVESNESNNTASMPITVSGYNSGYGNTVGQDLAVQSIQTGILSSNGQFIPTTVFHTYDRVAVQFQVANSGSVTTSPWYFQTALTDYPTKYYYSTVQPGVNANGSTLYTVTFDNVRLGSNSVTLQLDPAGYVQEANEGNNTATVNFSVSY